MLIELELEALKGIAEVARFFRSYRTIDIIQGKVWEIELRAMEYRPNTFGVSPHENH